MPLLTSLHPPKDTQQSKGMTTRMDSRMEGESRVPSAGQW
jgi:hypothetical protein